MPRDEFTPRPTRKIKRRRPVRLDFDSPEAVQKSAERFYGQYSEEALIARVMPVAVYYYVYGITKKGKAVFLGPFASAQAADSELAKMDDGEVFEKATRDLSRATREMKATLIARGTAPDRAIERLKHKL